VEEGEVCSALAFALLLPPLLLTGVKLTSFLFVSLLPPAGVKTTPFFTVLSDSASPGQDSSWRPTLSGRTSGGFAFVLFFPGAVGIAIAFLTFLRLGRSISNLRRAKSPSSVGDFVFSEPKHSIKDM
jgi:hypothetical protein